MIVEFRLNDKVDLDQIIEETLNDLKINSNQMQVIGDDFSSKIQIIS
jgi:hypothetical protein